MSGLLTQILFLRLVANSYISNCHNRSVVQQGAAEIKDFWKGRQTRMRWRTTHLGGRPIKETRQGSIPALSLPTI
jgi:hypothetical protein